MKTITSACSAMVLTAVIGCGGDVADSNWTGNVSSSSGDTLEQRKHDMQLIIRALRLYEGKFGRFPSAVLEVDGQPQSWREAILPELKYVLENNSLKKNAATARKDPISVYGEKTRFKLFTGAHTALESRQIIRILDSGAQTILVVEVAPDRAIPWDSPEDIPFDDSDPLVALGPLPEEGFVAGFADGHVEVLPNTISSDTFRALVSADGSEVLYKDSDGEWQSYSGRR